MKKVSFLLIKIAENSLQSIISSLLCAESFLQNIDYVQHYRCPYRNDKGCIWNHKRLDGTAVQCLFIS